MVWIVLYHFTTRYSQLFGVKYPITFDYGGTIGVAIFFILSGYFYFGKIITSECLSFTQVVFFLKLRYKKLYVPYLFSIVTIFLVYQFTSLEGRECSWVDFVANFILVCPFSPFAYVDGAHWFLATLIWLFFICAIFLMLPSNIRPKSVYIFELVVLGLSIFYNFGWIKFLIDPNCLLKFLLGYNIFVIIKERKDSIQHIAILLAIIVYYSILIKTIWLVLFVGIACLMLKYRELPMINNTNLFVWIGKYSFSWYLIHQNIGYILLNKLNDLGCNSEFWILLPMLVTLLMGICIQELSNKLLH